MISRWQDRSHTTVNSCVSTRKKEDGERVSYRNEKCHEDDPGDGYGESHDATDKNPCFEEEKA